MNVGTLKQIIKNIPEDYSVEFKYMSNKVSPISDIVEIDVQEHRFIIK